jgi:hypothetical protein
MFERYTERARRVLFFARYEASQLGSISIETEHLLLGLIREGKGLTSRIFARSHLSLENIRKEIEGRTVFREKVSTSVEIPFSAETKRVLQFAAEEADRLLHNYIGTEHLLLGILREERSVAASILMVITTWLALQMRHPSISWIAVFCAGVAMAPVFPTTLAMVGNRFPVATATAMGVVITSGWIGLAVSSKIIGGIAGGDPARIKKALLVLPAFSLLMVLVHLGL